MMVVWLIHNNFMEWIEQIIISPQLSVPFNIISKKCQKLVNWMRYYYKNNSTL